MKAAILAAILAAGDPPRPPERMELKATAVSYTSLQWAWNDLAVEQHYVLIDASGDILSRLPPSSSSPVAHTETGLLPGARYSRSVSAIAGWFPRVRPAR